MLIGNTAYDFKRFSVSPDDNNLKVLPLRHRREVAI